MSGITAPSLAQTTLRLDEALYREAKAAAALAGLTITRFIEDALRSKLRQGGAAPVVLPTYSSPEGYPYSPEVLKRLAAEVQERDDLRKGGLA
jgi:hypothetical protein